VKRLGANVSRTGETIFVPIGSIQERFGLLNVRFKVKLP
jgi:hypothetical protein